MTEQNPLASPPIWVDKLPDLQALAAELSRHPRVAVDTEANSLYVYREQVCLLQFSTPSQDYLVDPLALNDLTPLVDFFANPAIEKVFHAAEYDLIGLRRDFDLTFSNLFDTMLAARTLGYKQMGLSSLLKEKFELEMDKRYQKANWSARPLPPEQIDYARLDTHYLLNLRDVLETELRAADLWQLAQEDFARACQPLTNPEPKPQRERWERINGNQALTPRGQTALNELCLTRERLAERLNRPIFKVLDDRLLLKLATEMPQTQADLAAAGMTPRQLERFGKSILEALRRAAHAPLVRPTPTVKPSEKLLNRINALKTWRKMKAEELKVESDVVLPRQYVQAIAEQAPRSPAALAQIMDESPSRVQRFGEEILKIISP